MRYRHVVIGITLIISFYLNTDNSLAGGLLSRLAPAQPNLLDEAHADRELALQARSAHETLLQQDPLYLHKAELRALVQPLLYKVQFRTPCYSDQWFKNIETDCRLIVYNVCWARSIHEWALLTIPLDELYQREIIRTCIDLNFCACLLKCFFLPEDQKVFATCAHNLHHILLRNANQVLDDHCITGPTRPEALRLLTYTTAKLTLLFAGEVSRGATIGHTLLKDFYTVLARLPRNFITGWIHEVTKHNLSPIASYVDTETNTSFFKWHSNL